MLIVPCHLYLLHYAKGKCGVKLNGVLAVSMFSLEA